VEKKIIKNNGIKDIKNIFININLNSLTHKKNKIFCKINSKIAVLSPLINILNVAINISSKIKYLLYLKYRIIPKINGYNLSVKLPDNLSELKIPVY